MPTYTIVREKVTWIRDDPRRPGRGKITHPMVYTVRENGKDVHSFNTRREADEYVAYLTS